MSFGIGFLGVKALALAARSVVFLVVLSMVDELFGANSLMSFLSWVTVLGIALGFGSVDSVVVLCEADAARTSRCVLFASLAGIGLFPLIVFSESLAVSIFVASLNYGLTLWNFGLIRRRDAFQYENISNFYMLSLWAVYLCALPFETSDFSALAGLYVAFHALMLFISQYNVTAAVTPDSRFSTSALFGVSLNKLTWEVNYSALSRMPFLLPQYAASISSAFSYAYLFFEMASAMLSHYQSVFLKSAKANVAGWIRVVISLLVLNVMSLLILVLVLQSRHAVVGWVGSVIGRETALFVEGMADVETDGLVVFMLGMTALQSAAFGRYALKLEANGRLVIIASVISIVMLVAAYSATVGWALGSMVPFWAMFAAGVVVVALEVVVTRQGR